MFCVIQAQWVEVSLQQASRPTQTYGKKEEEEEKEEKEKEEGGGDTATVKRVPVNTSMAPLPQPHAWPGAWEANGTPTWRATAAAPLEMQHDSFLQSELSALSFGWFELSGG